MKLSTVIKRLQAYKRKYGDLAVCIHRLEIKDGPNGLHLADSLDAPPKFYYDKDGAIVVY